MSSGSGVRLHGAVDVVAGHPAVLAWRQLGAGHAAPRSVETLKERRKSSVYRLQGAGPDGSSVIAKRCRSDRAVLEHTIYTEVLPQLPVSALRCHGLVDGSDAEFAWLFIEDAAGEPYSAADPVHRQAAARWLGVLHTSTGGLGLRRLLPDRGPYYHLGVLRLARASIVENLGNAALSEDDVSVLRDVVDQCDLIEGRWRDVEELCAGLPEALVHGDFVGKNIRVRPSPSGVTVFLFDWEMAGWGVPTIDLAQAPLRAGGFSGNPDVEAYWSVVRERWPGVDLGAVHLAAGCATVFRCLAAIGWGTPALAGEWTEKPMYKMRYYNDALAEALEGIGWLPGRLPS